MHVTPEVDRGPLLCRTTFPIPPGVSLHGPIMLTILHARATVHSVIDNLIANRITRTPQDPLSGS